MTLLTILWFLAAAFWALCATGWLTVELLLPPRVLDRRERIVAGVLVSSAWTALLHTLVLATTRSLSTVLYGLFFLSLGQALLLGARRLDVRRKSRGSRPAAAAPESVPASPAPAGPEHPFTSRPTTPEGPWTRRLLAALLAAAALSMGLTGGSLGFIHDSLDVASYVAQLDRENTVEPARSVYGPDPLPAPDPRRGTFHTQMAVLSRASGQDAVDVWRLLPILLVPLALLTVFLLAREFLGSGRLGLLAAALFAALGIFTPDHFLQNIGYASRIGWVQGWVGLLAAQKFLRGGNRRLAALATLAAPALLGIHILSAAQYIATLGCLALAAAVAAPAGHPARRKGLVVTALALAATAPFLASRLLSTYRVLNPIFDHPQGLLLLGRGWSALHPAIAWGTLGWPGAAAVVLSFGEWTRRRASRGAAFLALATWIPLAIVFFPGTLTLIERLHAHSLTFRLLLIVPTPLLLARGIDRAWRGVRNAPGRAGAALLGAMICAGVVLHCAHAAGKWRIPAQRRAAWGEQAPLLQALAWMEDRLAPGLTVLSDPLTSYAIPAYTSHGTVAPFHQHSSPTDPTALARMREVQAVLNGLTDIRSTCAILDRYGVDVLVLNQEFERYQSAYGVFLSPLVHDLQRAKLDAYPELFTPLHTVSGIRIYGYEGKGKPKAFVPGRPLPAAFLLPANAVAPQEERLPVEGPPEDSPEAAPASPDTLVVVARDPDSPFRVADPGRLPIAAGAGVACLGLDPVGQVRAGETASLVFRWRRDGAPSRLPVETVVVLETDPPAPLLSRLPFQPALRRVWETVSGSVYRFGDRRAPLEHFAPPFLWRDGETYRDALFLWIPPHAVPGRYRIHLMVGERPFTENLELRDLLWDEGSMVGPVVGEVEILPSGAEPTAPAL